MTTDFVRILERTFKARDERDPKRKAKLNEDPLTSEWQTNKKYVVRFKNGASVLFKTREAAQAYVDQSAYDVLNAKRGPPTK